MHLIYVRPTPPLTFAQNNLTLLQCYVKPRICIKVFCFVLEFFFLTFSLLFYYNFIRAFLTKKPLNRIIFLCMT